MVFRYDDAWLAWPQAFPVSLRLPLAPVEFGNAQSKAFFSNLLPEGIVRQLLCRRLGISEDNDFALLEAIGGECAGALRLVSDFIFQKQTTDEAAEPLSVDDVNRLLASDAALSVAVGEGKMRLSLAGAQDKLPVIFIDGNIFLPVGSQPSTHILKLPNRHYKHLPANEVFIQTLASGIELYAVDAELLTKHAREPLCLVQRYDRRTEDGAFTIRLHQEDFCQALGYNASKKYQNEGGPGLGDCFALLDDASVEPLPDTRALVDWHLFNCIIGNADGHAKNLSLLYAEGTRLAPFYDLVCTHAYPNLNPNMAMKTGDAANPFKILRAHWHALSEELKIGEKYLISRVETMCEKVANALPEHTSQFEERYGRQPAVQMIAPGIRRRIRTLMNNLK